MVQRYEQRSRGMIPDSGGAWVPFLEYMELEGAVNALLSHFEIPPGPVRHRLRLLREKIAAAMDEKS